jgi:hypothetical protein
MLEKYFLRLATLDRIRGSWIGPAVERYGREVDSLAPIELRDPRRARGV